MRYWLNRIALVLLGLPVAASLALLVLQRLDRGVRGPAADPSGVAFGTLLGASFWWVTWQQIRRKERTPGPGGSEPGADQ